jgi:hypothetical protein
MQRHFQNTDGKVVAEFSKALENDLIYPYRESPFRAENGRSFYTSSGYEIYLVQLDTDLKKLNQTHFIPQPFIIPSSPHCDYVYGATFNNTSWRKWILPGS